MTYRVPRSSTGPTPETTPGWVRCRLFEEVFAPFREGERKHHAVFGVRCTVVPQASRSFSSTATYWAPSGSMNLRTAHPVPATTSRISSRDTNSQSYQGPLRLR